MELGGSRPKILVHEKGLEFDYWKLVNPTDDELREEDCQKYIQDFISGGFDGVASALGELPILYEQVQNLEQLESMYEGQLAALENFVSSTSRLFTDSLEAFQYAMQGVDVLNQTCEHRRDDQFSGWCQYDLASKSGGRKAKFWTQNGTRKEISK
ncbi:MAG: hypothetical protein LBI13_00050 [Streptococcaceae bacterium]|nr:hypothetical protein [Streptococcaceae bacterium]